MLFAGDCTTEGLHRADRRAQPCEAVLAWSWSTRGTWVHGIAVTATLQYRRVIISCWQCMPPGTATVYNTWVTRRQDHFLPAAATQTPTHPCFCRSQRGELAGESQALHQVLLGTTQ